MPNVCSVRILRKNEAREARETVTLAHTSQGNGESNERDQINLVCWFCFCYREQDEGRL
jgi:hypothetical protein